MEARIETLRAKDENGNEYQVLPRTVLKALRLEDGRLLQEALDDLDAHDTTLPMTVVSAGSTEEEINNFYDNYSAEMGNYTNYKAVVSHGCGHSILGGGAFLLEGNKTLTNYEWQKLTSYGDINSVFRKFVRSKDNGTWSPWKAVDIGNVLTASKSVYVDATNGDDATGDGSQSKPWKTIQKAVNECPAIGIGNIYYNIYLAEGTYDEAVAIKSTIRINISSGTSTIDNADKFLVKYIAVLEDTTVHVQGVKFYGNTNQYSKIGFYCCGNSRLHYCKFDDCICQTYGNSATIRLENSDLSNYQSGTINYGVIRADGGVISCYNITGTNNKGGYGIGSTSLYSRIFIVNGCTLEADTKFIGHGSGCLQAGNIGWKTIGSVTGAKSVAIDSEKYTEFKVKIKIPNTTLSFDIYLTSAELTDTEQRPAYGNMFKTNDYYGGSIAVTKKIIRLDYIWKNGESITDTTTMTVYGRRA